jgi:hypothetical protein
MTPTELRKLAGAYCCYQHVDVATALLKAADEIERLQARDAERLYPGHRCDFSADLKTMTRERDQARAEVGRLRESLDRIRCYESMRAKSTRSAYSHVWDIANAALTEKVAGKAENP